MPITPNNKYFNILFCVRIQDYEGGDYSPEHYYMKEELKSFIFNTPHHRMCVQHT